MSLKTTTIEGVLERLKGGRATQVQALVGGLAAGAAVYKLLRSGANDDDAEQDETEAPQAAA